MGDDTEMDANFKQDTVCKFLTQPKSFSASSCSVDYDIDSRLAERLATTTYEHESFSAQTPVIWIPKDNYGVSEDEVRAFREADSSLEISNTYAYFETNNTITVMNDF